MNTDTKPRSEDEYKALITKVAQGTATEEEKRALSEFVVKGMKEIEAILDEDNK